MMEKTHFKSDWSTTEAEHDELIAKREELRQQAARVDRSKCSYMEEETYVMGDGSVWRYTYYYDSLSMSLYKHTPMKW